MIPKEILEKVRKIELRTRNLVNDVFSGEYHSVFKGAGMEFSEVREYQPGDDVRSIDWNVTARMGHPFVKKYVEERELTVVLVVDASASGNFGSFEKMKGEIAVEICAVLAFSAIKNNDRVSLLVFTDRIEEFIPPKKGKKHVLRVIRELLYFKPKNKGTNIGCALEYLNKVLTRKSVIFLVSDFIAEGYETALRIANQKHDVIAITVSDPREFELPKIGLLELEDAETGLEITTDPRSNWFRTEYFRRAKEKAGNLKRIFNSMGIDSVDIRTNESYVEPLMSFFKMREKKFR